jgi:hypothetical protein
MTLQVLAGNYVLSALTKLIKSDGAWIWNSQYMPVQYAKIQAQHYYTTLQNRDLGWGGTLNELCTQHAWLCMLVYAPGLIVELLTFLMLFGRVLPAARRPGGYARTRRGDHEPRLSSAPVDFLALRCQSSLLDR